MAPKKKKRLRRFPHVFCDPLHPAAREPIFLAILLNLLRKKKSRNDAKGKG
jgi:hypothetical protein